MWKRGEEREGRSLGTGEHISGVWKRGRVGHRGAHLWCVEEREGRSLGTGEHISGVW